MSETKTTKSELKWSDPKRVATRNGDRILRTAKPDENFWVVWKEKKDELRLKGVTVTKDDKNQWLVCWWKPISAEAEKASMEASRAEDSDIFIPAPDGLEYMPFQRAGIDFGSKRNNVLIADEMGLGKTIQALGIINIDESIKNVIIVCPASLKLNWKRECKKWLVRDNGVSIIPNGDEWLMPQFVDTKIVIINYELLKKHEARIRRIKWDLIVVDEAHYLKNPKAQRTKAILGSGKKIPCIDSRRFIALTGTPIPNRPIEIFPILNRISPETFPSYWAFGKKYCGGKTGFAGKMDFTGSSNLEDLQRLLRGSGSMVRRRKMDVLTELPDKVRQVIEIPPMADMRRMLNEQTRIWTLHEDTIGQLKARKLMAEVNEDVEEFRDVARELRDGITVGFAEMSKIRAQIALLKAPYVNQHVADVLNETNKVIIMCHHRKLLDAMMAALIKSGVECVTVHGGIVNKDKRQEAVDRFQNDPNVRVFIGTIKAAGVGLTLTASSTVIFAEQDWTPGYMDQAEDRAHRIGQKDSVLVQHLVMEDSLDSTMLKRVVSKASDIESALDINCAIPMVEGHDELPPDVIEAEVKLKDRSKYRTIGEGMTADQVDTVLNALKYVSAMDTDRASAVNGVGFSKIDTFIGNDLAQRTSLSPAQAGLAFTLTNKYRRQIPEKYLRVLKIDK